MRQGFLEEVVAHTPGISSLKIEQLGASNVKDLPTVIPSSSLIFTVCLGQVRPDLVLILLHLG